MDGGSTPDSDGKTLYRQTIFEEVPYSELEEMFTFPLTLDKIWASPEFNNGWEDEGITGLVDVNEAITEVNGHAGTSYHL